MKIIEKAPSSPPQPPRPAESPSQKPQTQSYSSTLVSPHAPTWVESISHFFQWIWSRIASLFSWILPQKTKTPEPSASPASPVSSATPSSQTSQTSLAPPAPPAPSAPPAPPAPEIVRAIQSAQKHDAANQSMIPGLIKKATFKFILFGSLYRISKLPLLNRFGNHIFVIPLTHEAVTSSSHVLEKIANYAFPKLSTHWKQIGSLTIANLVVWKTAESFGYPLGWILLMSTATNVYKIISQANVASEQQRAMMMRQLTT